MVLALIFIAGRIQPLFSLVDSEAEFFRDVHGAFSSTVRSGVNFPRSCFRGKITVFTVSPCFRDGYSRSHPHHRCREKLVIPLPPKPLPNKLHCPISLQTISAQKLQFPCCKDNIVPITAKKDQVKRCKQVICAPLGNKVLCYDGRVGVDRVSIPRFTYDLMLYWATYRVFFLFSFFNRGILAFLSG